MLLPPHHAPLSCTLLPPLRGLCGVDGRCAGGEAERVVIGRGGDELRSVAVSGRGCGEARSDDHGGATGSTNSIDAGSGDAG